MLRGDIMGIEELELELKNLKAFAYDLDGEYAKLKEKIDLITEEIKNLKENKQEEIKSDDVIELPTPEVSVVEIPENNDVVVEQSTEEVVQEPKTDVVVAQAFETQEVALPQVVQEETVATTPLIVTEEVQPKEEGIGAQELDQTPLTPTSIEEVKQPENTVVVKEDLNASKAILTTTTQAEKLRGSKEDQKAKVFEVAESSISEGQQAEVSTTGEKENIEQQVQDMLNRQQELYNSGNLKEAEAIGNELTKKIGEVS